MGDESSDENQAIYRKAYDLAVEMTAERRQSTDPALWQDMSSALAGHIRAVIGRQLGRSPSDPDVFEAVNDAVNGRRPRW
jgi:hypothetical protein